MDIKIISDDKLWADTLGIALSVFGEPKFTTYNAFDEATEVSLLKSKKGTILLIDSAIPGVDYWSLVSWLKVNFAGKTIIFTEARSYNIHRSQLIKYGCHAVLSKTDGFTVCWEAILAFRKGDKYFTAKKYSPFSQLTDKDKNFVRALLLYEVSELKEMYAVSQQAVNKKKLLIYKKLNITANNPDIEFKLLAALHKL